MKVTVLTPVYNRAYTIKKLYNSLIKQTASNFEWLIIDDGSKDNIKQVIDEFIKENKIKIIYSYQENGGKHRALNKGISIIKTEMTFIVDSDDYLSIDAIETITKYYNKYKGKKDICGFSFLRCFEDGKINGPKYDKDDFISDYITYRLNKHNWGDKAEVYYTEILKKYPFLEVKGEKFLVESYVWAKMALDYNTVYINKAIYIGEYQQDGLTRNVVKRRYDSPIGMVEKSKVLCNKKANLAVKTKAILNYIVYSNIANISFKKQFKEINYKPLFFLLYPFGLLLLLKTKHDIRSI